MRLDETCFTVVAVKTLNDSQANEPVVEVACVKIRNLRITERYQALLNPGVLLSEDFTRQTGLYPADVFEQPTLEVRLPEIAQFIDRDIIIWSHLPRNGNALYRHFRLTQPKEKEFFLRTLAEQALPDLSRYTLPVLADYYRLPERSPARAESAAEIAAELFLRLLETLHAEHGVETIVDLLAFCPAPKKDTRRSKRNLPFDRERLKHYPATPGVYFMKNRLGEILYVGKAKNLRSRLRSYFQSQSKLAPKIAAMMKQVAMIDVIRVGSELEALLLEARLIKLHRPFFNKMVKEYQGMVFMKVSLNEPWPRVSVAIETDDPGAAYFGPFPRKTGLEHRLEILNRIFKLRSCSDSVFREHRESPCMQFHLGLCSGPCAGKIGQGDYRDSVEDFIAYLEQKPSRAIEHLVSKRDAYTEELMFEKAAQVHAQLEALEQLQFRSYGFIRAIEEHNCLIILPDAEPDAVRVLSVLQGQPYEWRSFRPRLDSVSELETLIRALFEKQPASPDSGRATTIPKALFEEARLLSTWLLQHSEDEGHAIYLQHKMPGQVLGELLGVLPNFLGSGDLPVTDPADPGVSPEEADEMDNAEWEREWASGG
jgi:DNA polymerase-3 subunit epsilon